MLLRCPVRIVDGGEPAPDVVAVVHRLQPGVPAIFGVQVFVRQLSQGVVLAGAQYHRRTVIDLVGDLLEPLGVVIGKLPVDRIGIRPTVRGLAFFHVAGQVIVVAGGAVQAAFLIFGNGLDGPVAAVVISHSVEVADCAAGLAQQFCFGPGHLAAHQVIVAGIIAQFRHISVVQAFRIPLAAIEKCVVVIISHSEHIVGGDTGRESGVGIAVDGGAGALALCPLLSRSDFTFSRLLSVVL